MTQGKVVEPGELGPSEVHTPGAFAHQVIAPTPEQAADKRVEKLTVSHHGRWRRCGSRPAAWSGSDSAPRELELSVLGLATLETKPAAAEVATVPAGCEPVRVATTRTPTDPAHGSGGRGPGRHRADRLGRRARRQ